MDAGRAGLKARIDRALELQRERAWRAGRSPLEPSWPTCCWLIGGGHEGRGDRQEIPRMFYQEEDTGWEVEEALTLSQVPPSSGPVAGLRSPWAPLPKPRSTRPEAAVGP